MSTGGVGYEMDRTDSYKFENDIVDFVTYELSESAMYWDGNKYQDISYGE